MGSTVTVEVKDEAEAYAVKYTMENEFLALLKKERMNEVQENRDMFGLAAVLVSKGCHSKFTEIVCCKIQEKMQRRAEIFTLKQHSGIANLIQASLDLAGPCADV